MRKCSHCGMEITKDDEHIKIHGEYYCDNCYEEHPTTDYFVDGEHVGTCEYVEHIRDESDWEETE